MRTNFGGTLQPCKLRLCICMSKAYPYLIDHSPDGRILVHDYLYKDVLSIGKKASGFLQLENQ